MLNLSFVRWEKKFKMFSSLNHINNYALRWPVLHIAVVGRPASAVCGGGELLAGAMETGHTSAGMSSAGRCGYGVACLWLGQLLPTYQVYEQKKRLPQTSIEELKGIKNKN